MKTLTTFILAGALALLAQPNQLDLRQDPPVAVQSERVSSAYTGTSGATTYYYWVVTRYPIGFIVPTAPVVVGGAAALGGGNSVALGWPAMTGASSYDVLRTTTNAAPSSCTCAVVLATTGTTLTDNGGALSAWPPGGLNSAGVAQAELQINNRDAEAPYIAIAVRNAQRTLNYQLGINLVVPGSISTATIVNVLGNVYGVALFSDGTDNVTRWPALLAAVPAGSILYFPKGSYHNSTEFGFILTKTLHVIGEGSGWYDGSAVQDATLFLDPIALNNQKGSSVRHVAIDARNATGGHADGISSGSAVTTHGGHVIDDILYIGSGAVNPSHGVVMQSGPDNIITNIRGYGAYHFLAIRSSKTQASNLWCADCTDVVVKSDTGSGTVVNVSISDLQCNAYQTSTVCGLTITSEAAGLYTYNVVASNLTLNGANYPIVLNSENGGTVMGVVINGITSFDCDNPVTTLTATTGTIQNVTINGGVFLNAAAGPNNALPAVNLRYFGVSVNGSVLPSGSAVTFATLPATPTVGDMTYCSACTVAAGECATGAGTALAIYNGATWRCTALP